MTTKIFTSYVVVTVMVMALALMGITFAYASEVTGVLSSDASASSLNSGTIAGNVTSGDNGTLSGSVTSESDDGGSSSGGSSGGSSSSNSPSGAVLGASTSNVSSPSFPNAGFAPTNACVLTNDMEILSIR